MTYMRRLLTVSVALIVLLGRASRPRRPCPRLPRRGRVRDQRRPSTRSPAAAARRTSAAISASCARGPAAPRPSAARTGAFGTAPRGQRQRVSRAPQTAPAATTSGATLTDRRLHPQQPRPRPVPDGSLDRLRTEPERRRARARAIRRRAVRRRTLSRPINGSAAPADREDLADAQACVRLRPGAVNGDVRHSWSRRAPSTPAATSARSAGCPRPAREALDRDRQRLLRVQPGLRRLGHALGSRTAAGLYVGGDYNGIGGEVRSDLAKLSPTSGNAFSAWIANASATVNTLALADGALFAGGSSRRHGRREPGPDRKVSASSGNLFGSWDPGANGAGPRPGCLGSELYAIGDFTTIDGTGRNHMAKLSTSSGAAFGSFNPNLDSSGHAVDAPVRRRRSRRAETSSRQPDIARQHRGPERERLADGLLPRMPTTRSGRWR